MPKAAAVQIAGANALRRDLKKMGEPGGAILRQISDAGMVAGQPVLARARNAWPVVTGAHRDSVRLRRSVSGATIAEGNARLGGTGWLDFGGTRPNDNDGRPYLTKGRYLYPAIAGEADRVARLYSAELQKIIDAMSWTNDTTNATQVTD